MVARRWPCGGKDGGGNSTVAVASLVAEVAAWRKRKFSCSNSAFGNAAAAWWWRRQQWCVGGAAWCMLIIILIVTMTMMIDYWLFLCCGGGGKGRGRGLAACVAGDRRDGRQWQSQWWLFEQKRGWTRKKERGNWKMGLFFHAVLFYFCFLAYLFQCRSIDFCHCCCVLL